MSCLALLCASLVLSANILLTSANQRPGIIEERRDYVVAMGTMVSRLPLVAASIAWRKGIRTVIAINDTAGVALANHHKENDQEVYVYHPDTGQEGVRDRQAWGLYYPGDYRAAVVVASAYELHGDTFKWLLFCDDDTVFFMHNVRKLLQDYDHNLPYMITDNHWHSAGHPSFSAPRCFPCHYKGPFEVNSSEMDPRALKEPFYGVVGCPCTRPTACGSVEVVKDHVQRPQKPVPGCHTPIGHGGAGVILSIGLLRKLSGKEWRKCIEDVPRCTGSDCLLAVAVERCTGILSTDPGPFLLHKHKKYVLFDNPEYRPLLLNSLEHISVAKTPACDSHCQWLLENAVSIHIGARGFGAFERGAAAIWKAAYSHHAAVNFLANMQIYQELCTAAFGNISMLP